jgi:hypothetical protein
MAATRAPAARNLPAISTRATMARYGKVRTGEDNHMWRGGRSIASNGYVLVRVGHGHHLADVRGYAYEHRVVAEEKLGRRLTPGEVVHHVDENRQNNHPDNIEIKASNWHHHKEHRRSGKRLRDPGEENPITSCECGCGSSFLLFDSIGRPRRFVSGHNLDKGRST